ncbi:uncharacterized protein [Paramisgurnus dabryanus]|uniref:uncharacterized protein isoform X2 n=1 Tax=Paramisgurnus dabryanus TaxID=90735 RepID=UPI003CCFABF6
MSLSLPSRWATGREQGGNEMSRTLKTKGEGGRRTQAPTWSRLPVARSFVLLEAESKLDECCKSLLKLRTWVSLVWALPCVFTMFRRVTQCFSFLLYRYPLRHKAQLVGFTMALTSWLDSAYRKYRSRSVAPQNNHSLSSSLHRYRLGHKARLVCFTMVPTSWLDSAYRKYRSHSVAPQNNHSLSSSLHRYRLGHKAQLVCFTMALTSWLDSAYRKYRSRSVAPQNNHSLSSSLHRYRLGHKAQLVCFTMALTSWLDSAYRKYRSRSVAPQNNHSLSSSLHRYPPSETPDGVSCPYVASGANPLDGCAVAEGWEYTTSHRAERFPFLAAVRRSNAGQGRPFVEATGR